MLAIYLDIYKFISRNVEYKFRGIGIGNGRISEAKRSVAKAEGKIGERRTTNKTIIVPFRKRIAYAPADVHAVFKSVIILRHGYYHRTTPVQPIYTPLIIPSLPLPLSFSSPLSSPRVTLELTRQLFRSTHSPPSPPRNFRNSSLFNLFPGRGGTRRERLRFESRFYYLTVPPPSRYFPFLSRALSLLFSISFAIFSTPVFVPKEK